MYTHTRPNSFLSKHLLSAKQLFDFYVSGYEDPLRNLVARETAPVKAYL